MLRYLAKSNTITTWISLLTKLGLNAALIPLIAIRLSPIEANLWLLLLTIISITTVLDFGLTPTLSRFISYAINSHNQKNNAGELDYSIFQVKDVIKAIKIAYAILGVTSFVIALIFMRYFLEGHIGKLDQQNEGWIIVLITSITIGITLWGGGSIAYFQGVSQIYVYRNVEIVSSLLTILALLLATYYSLSLLTLTSIYCTGQIIGIVGIKYVAAKMIGNYDQEPAKINKKLLNQVISSSWKSGVGVASTFIAIQSIGIIVSLVATPEEGSFFLLAQRIIQAVSSLGNVPFYVSLPQMAGKYVAGNKSSLYRLSMRKMLLSNIVTGVALTIIGHAWLNQSKILPESIVIETVTFSSEQWFFLCIASIIERIGAMYLQLYTLSNKVIWHKVNSISAAIMIVGMPLLYGWIGVIGLPLSIIIAYSIYYTPISIIKSRDVLTQGLSKHFLVSSGFIFFAFLIFNFNFAFR